MKLKVGDKLIFKGYILQNTLYKKCDPDPNLFFKMNKIYTINSIHGDKYYITAISNTLWYFHKKQKDDYYIWNFKF